MSYPEILTQQDLDVLKFFRNEDRPKIVTLCGSTRFKREFEIANKELTLRGYIVLTVGHFMHSDDKPITEEQKVQLDQLHKRKIDLADLVLIINPNNYIGLSTRSEIDYAEHTGKSIIYWYGLEDELFDRLSDFIE